VITKRKIRDKPVIEISEIIFLGISRQIEFLELHGQEVSPKQMNDCVRMSSDKVSSRVPWFRKDMEVGDLSIQFDPQDMQKIASQINLRYKRSTSTCSDHRRKHQRCPADCVGRRKEKQKRNSASLCSQVVWVDGKEKIIVGMKKMSKTLEDTAVETLISRFHSFSPKKDTGKEPPVPPPTAPQSNIPNPTKKSPNFRRHSNPV
jgi:hypothetical protein